MCFSLFQVAAGCRALWRRRVVPFPLLSSHVPPCVFPCVLVTPHPHPLLTSSPLLCRHYSPKSPSHPMLGIKPTHCQPNDCLDRPARQPVCLLHHRNMDSVSYSKIFPVCAVIFKHSVSTILQILQTGICWSKNMLTDISILSCGSVSVLSPEWPFILSLVY